MLAQALWGLPLLSPPLLASRALAEILKMEGTQPCWRTAPVRACFKLHKGANETSTVPTHRDFWEVVLPASLSLTHSSHVPRWGVSFCDRLLSSLLCPPGSVPIYAYHNGSFFHCHITISSRPLSLAPTDLLHFMIWCPWLVTEERCHLTKLPLWSQTCSSGP